MVLLFAGALAIAAALLTGGRIRHIAELPLRAPLLIVAILIAQAFVLESDLGALAAPAHIATYAAAGVWVWLNRHIRGLGILAAGAACNAAAIVSNGGVMPATPWAVRTAGLEQTNGFDNSGVVSDPTLWWLGDIFAIPAGWPLANVFSIGDIVLIVGLFTLVRTASRPAAGHARQPDKVNLERTPPPRGHRILATASRLTGLPARPTTVMVAGLVVLLISAVGAAISIATVTAAEQTAPTAVILALLAGGAVAQAHPLIHRSQAFSLVNGYLLVAAVAAPAIAIPGTVIAIGAGDTIGRLRKPRPIGQGSNPALTRFKTVASTAITTVAAAIVALAIIATVGNDLSDHGVWFALVLGSVAFEVLTHVMVDTLAALATQQRLSPAAFRFHNAELIGAILLAAIVPVAAAVAHTGQPLLIGMTILPLILWSTTADHLNRQAEAMSLDHVSGLPTRKVFLDDLTQRTTTRSVSVAKFVDLHELEQAFGTSVADAVIGLAADRMSSAFAGMTLGHVSRDVFAIADADPAELLARLNGTYTVTDIPVPVAVVVGTANCASDPASLLLRAENALTHGNGTIRTHTDSMPMGTPADLRRADELRNAFTHGEIVPFYQPIMSAGDNPVMVGSEALARWNHPTEGVLAPGAWLPKLTRMGLDHKLTSIMIDRVCADIAQWCSDHDAAVRVNLNVTAVDIGSGDLAAQILLAAQSHRIDPSMLTIEVTEETAMVAPDATTETIAELHRLGCKVAIDDVGVGHSSLGRIAQFEFDELKIDRALIREAHTSTRTVMVLSTLVDLGHNLGMRVVAEGIENHRDTRLMTQLGVDKLQGYAFARPAAADEFITAAVMYGETMPATAPDTPADAHTPPAPPRP